MEDIRIYEEIIRLMKERRPAALAIVIESSGSTPRKAGAKMLVDEKGLLMGTVGGGPSEVEVLRLAGETIRDRKSRTLTFHLDEKSGYVCGGSVTFYVEPVSVPPQVVIVGAGHVGRALAEAAEHAGFLTRLIDVEGKEKFLKEVPVDRASYIVIVTRGHNLDFLAAREALETDAAYIGMVGSRRKRVAMEKIFSEEGISREELERIISPAGLPIGAETPREIAVSIVAQLIQVRRRHEDRGVGASGGTFQENGSMQAPSPPG